MLAWLYWMITMGLFDRFKSGATTTQKASAAVSPTQKGLTAKEWNDKGFALKNLGRHQEAIQCFDTALAIDPRNVDAWYNKGATLINLGRHQEAIQCLDKALEIDPKNARAQQAKRIFSASKETN
jgi:tetratricopeptide (TPR) repeat protein